MDNRELTDAVLNLTKEVGTLNGSVQANNVSVKRLDDNISTMDEKIDEFFKNRYETCPYVARKRENKDTEDGEVMKRRLKVAVVALIVAGIALIPSWVLLFTTVL